MQEHDYKLFVTRPEHLTEWEFFTWRHKDPINLIFHLFSLSLFLFPAIYMFIEPSWIMVGLILLSIPVGSAGHCLSKDGIVRSKDFAHPNTVIFLIIIFGMIALRKYKTHLTGIEAKIRSHIDLFLLGK